MKLIMENWRDYQKQTLEEQQLLTEGAIWDTVSAGFGKLIGIPAKLDKMIEEATEIIKKNAGEAIKELAKDPKIVEIGKEITDIIKDSPPLSEEVTKADVAAGVAAYLETRGVPAEILNNLKDEVATLAAKVVLESAEEVTNVTAPPKVRDFLLRFGAKAAGPFAFGFLDNFIMVVAGNFIDGLLLTYLRGFGGTMLAAGIGNTFSDGVGEVANDFIKHQVKKIKVPTGLDMDNTVKTFGVSHKDPKIKTQKLDPDAVSDAEMENAPKWMKFMDRFATLLGILIGCLVGLGAGMAVKALVSEEEEKKQ